MFHESFMGEEVSRMFQGCFMIFKDVSRVFQGSFNKTLKVFKKSLMVQGTHRSFPSRMRGCCITVWEKLLDKTFCLLNISLYNVYAKIEEYPKSK